MEKRKEYAAVDLFKMFCAILVMLIHTKPFENIFWLDAGIGMITRFAVPFFFTVSGYFLFKKVDLHPKANLRIIGSYLWRLLRFYLIWFVILRLVDIAVSGTVQEVRYYVKQFFFTTDGSPLWFVNALLWAVIINAGLNIIFKKKAVFFIGVFFLVLGYMSSTLLGVTGNWHIINILKPVTKFIGIQNGLFFAFPYVAMGAVLAEIDLRAEYQKDILLTLFFFACLGVESIIAVMKLGAPFTFLWIFALPMTWFVVRLMLTIKLEIKPIYYTIRKISTLFYVLHVVVFKLLQYCIHSVGLPDHMNLVLTIATLVITSILSYGGFLMSRKCAWLKYAM